MIDKRKSISRTHPYAKPAGVLNLIGLFGVLFTAVTFYLFIHASEFLPLVAECAAFTAASFFAATGIRADRKWGRWAGVVVAVPTLAFVPFGTIAGAYVLVALLLRRPTSGPAPILHVD